MGKPRMIVLIRHGQSEGNKNRDIHQTIPDHRVKLTPEGWSQAKDAGRRLRELLLPTDTLHFFTSPYRRTRETTEGILATLTSDEPSPTPFPRQSIKVYEEPRLREQDFGNFQPCSAEMERMWQERADYGHFFYRIPNGESAADAYDRVSGFNESLWRQFGEEDCASVCVLVTHGLMSRIFLMKWYHFSVEYFEDLRNVNHCEFLIMRKSPDSGKYILENKLRTWSELKRERAAAQAIKDKEKNKEGAKDKALEKLDKLNTTSSLIPAPGNTQSPVPIRKKWGGCPNGCDHGRHYHKKEYGRENSMHAMPSLTQPGSNAANTFTNTIIATLSSTSVTSTINSGDSLLSRRPLAAARRWANSSEEDSDDPRGKIHASSSNGNGPRPITVPGIDVQSSLDEVVSSPDQTPSFITMEDRLKHRLIASPNQVRSLSLVERMGRDFGGSHSGNTSQTSDTEFSAEENQLSVRERMEGRTKTRENDEKNIAEIGGVGGGNGSVLRGGGSGKYGANTGNGGTENNTFTATGSIGNVDGGGSKSQSSATTAPKRTPTITRSSETRGGGRAYADALGDKTDVGSDGGGTDADTEDGHDDCEEDEEEDEEDAHDDGGGGGGCEEDLEVAECRDRSLKGSVY